MISMLGLLMLTSFAFLSGQTANAQTVEGPVAHFNLTGTALVDPVTGRPKGLTVAQAKHAPRLLHFFPADAVTNTGRTLLDDVGGLTLTTAGTSKLSVVAPEYTTVAASPSGLLTLSEPFRLSGNKPFYAMALYSNTGLGLAGFHFHGGGANPSTGQLELWNDTLTSSSLIGTMADTVGDETYADGAGKTDVAVGMLVTPGQDVEFFYAGPEGYWENNQVSMIGITNIPPISTNSGAIANASVGLRKFYGFIVYEFDSKPTDWKAATIEMRTNWLAGKKVPYSGW